MASRLYNRDRRRGLGDIGDFFNSPDFTLSDPFNSLSTDLGGGTTLSDSIATPSSGSGFFNFNLFGSDLNQSLNPISSDISSVNSTLATPTYAPSSLPNGSNIVSTIDKAVPSLIQTTENILTRQFAVPNVGPGTQYTSNANGSYSISTLPTGATAVANSLGSLLPLLLIGGLALLLFKK